MDARALTNLLGAIDTLKAVELSFAVCAIGFVLWGLCDVLGILRYTSERSTVVTAGAGKVALGIAGLWFILII